MLSADQSEMYNYICELPKFRSLICPLKYLNVQKKYLCSLNHVHISGVPINAAEPR